jgi:hypothetical protein
MKKPFTTQRTTFQISAFALGPVPLALSPKAEHPKKSFLTERTHFKMRKPFEIKAFI